MPFSRPFSKREEPVALSAEPERRRPWLWPLVALVVGMLIGGLGVGFFMQGRQAPVATPAPSPTAAATPTADVTPVNVPRACLRIADEAKVLQGQLDAAVAAARDLKASELSDLVRQIDEQQNVLQTHAQVCRQGVETPVPVTPTATPSDTAAPDDAATGAPASPTPRSTSGTQDDQKRAAGATARPAPAANGAKATP